MNIPKNIIKTMNLAQNQEHTKSFYEYVAEELDEIFDIPWYNNNKNVEDRCTVCGTTGFATALLCSFDEFDLDDVREWYMSLGWNEKTDTDESYVADQDIAKLICRAIFDPKTKKRIDIAEDVET